MITEDTSNSPEIPKIDLAKRELLYKEQLKQARLFLLNGQGIVGPMDERWRLLDELIEPLENMIMKRSNY